MGIQVSKAFHANIYIAGTNDQIGRASEVKLPDIAPDVVEHKGLGMVGTLELPAGLQKMNVSIKWDGIYSDAFRFGANPFQARRFQARASVQTYDAQGLVNEVPLVVLFSGTFTKLGGLAFKAKESATQETEIACHYIKCTLGGVDQYEIDVLNNVWIVDGVDVLEQLRGNLSG